MLLICAVQPLKIAAIERHNGSALRYRRRENFRSLQRLHPIFLFAELSTRHGRVAAEFRQLGKESSHPNTNAPRLILFIFSNLALNLVAVAVRVRPSLNQIDGFQGGIATKNVRLGY